MAKVESLQTHRDPLSGLLFAFGFPSFPPSRPLSLSLSLAFSLDLFLSFFLLHLSLLSLSRSLIPSFSLFDFVCSISLFLSHSLSLSPSLSLSLSVRRGIPCVTSLASSLQHTRGRFTHTHTHTPFFRCIFLAMKAI